MKKNLKFLLLAPMFMAILCESDEDLPCGFSEPDAYVVNVENISESYAIGETFFLKSELSSELSNSCNNDELELVTNNFGFRDAIFILKLNNSLNGLNAEISQNYNVTYDIGEGVDGNYCSEALEVLPVLSNDNSTYQYRLGISITEPGDYCIVSAASLTFLNTTQQNNAQIFELYNTLDNKIKFDTCGDIYTRVGTEDYYFFTVE